MKAVILAGGFGTRLSEETIVNKTYGSNRRQTYSLHIMKIYSAHESMIL